MIPVPNYLYYLGHVQLTWLLDLQFKQLRNKYLQEMEKKTWTSCPTHLTSQFKERRNDYLQEKKQKETTATRVRYDHNTQIHHPVNRSTKQT